MFKKHTNTITLKKHNINHEINGRITSIFALNWLLVYIHIKKKSNVAVFKLLFLTYHTFYAFECLSIILIM